MTPVVIKELLHQTPPKFDLDSGDKIPNIQEKSIKTKGVMERNFESQFERVVGGTEEERKEVLGHLEREAQTPSTDYASYEVEPTERDEQVIAWVEPLVDNMVRQYGGDPKQMMREKIHILRHGSTEEITGFPLRAAQHELREEIVIDRMQSDISFAAGLAHELFHRKSYKTVQIKEGESRKKLEPYRSGIAVTARQWGNTTRYLGELHEAIVQKLEKQLLANEILTNPLFEEEYKATEEVKQWARNYLQARGKEKTLRSVERIAAIPDADEILAVLHGKGADDEKWSYVDKNLSALSKQGELVEMGRSELVQKLDKFTEDILKANPDRFSTREDVFDFLAKANFTGSLMPFGRLVERTFGKGSFRRFGHQKDYSM